jgi:plasmid segregation protein ParM
MTEKNKKEKLENVIHKFLKEKSFLETVMDITGKSESDISSFDKEIGAIDIGYGNTKYLSGILNNEMNFGLFPSLTPIAPNLDMSGGMLGRRNTKIIDLDSVRYEIGVDTEMTSNGTDTSRNLNDSYALSEPYHALFLGALSYMEKDHYDVLVMGLPVKYMYNAKYIEEKFTGIHKLPDGKECKVDKIVVIPQPLGGFYDIAIKEDCYEDMIDEVTLVVDPGYLTFDFLLLNGLRPIENRSDALAGGMSRVLSAMAKSISSEIGRSYEDYNAIDKALRKPRRIKNPETGIKEEKRVIKINGVAYDLLPHIKQTTPVIENSITYMKNKVGSYDDIDNIVLVGGPENVFERKIREHLSNREVFKSATPIYSNVSGFWFWGLITLLTDS